MAAPVILCIAPVLSVLRPALGPATLKAGLTAAGIDAQTLYLNLDFADYCGLADNEWLAEDIPTHLLAGDWLFAHLLDTAPAPAAAEHAARLAAQVGPQRWRDLERLRRGCGDFIDTMARRLATSGAPLVGFSTVFQQTAASLALAAGLKRIAPDTHVCFGGANCHGPMGPALLERFAQIDSVFTGNADGIFTEFVQALLAGRPRALPGMLLRGHRPCVLPPPAASMDDLPVPDHDDYFAQLSGRRFATQLRPAVTYESSRGCWWGQKHHCTFCGLNSDSMAFKAKSAGRVRAELGAQALRHGVTRFCAADNILALDHIESVFGPIAADSLGWTFFYEIKANLSEARLRTLARAGVTWVQPGIESLDDGVLRIMRKGVTALANVRLLRNCQEIGIGAVWNLLYGFPDEPPHAYERMAQWLPLLEHLRPPTSCSRIRIDRFSPNHEQATAMGFDGVTPAPAYGALYGGDAAWLARIAYFFDGRPPQGECFDYVDALRAAVAQWRAAWYGGGAPELRLERLGPIALLRDTRRCAIQQLHLLEPAQVALLDACRDAAPVARVLQQHAADWPGDAAARFEELVALRLMLVDGNAALSLQVDGSGLLIDAPQRADFPWGYWVAAEDTPPVRADRAICTEELPS